MRSGKNKLSREVARSPRVPWWRNYPLLISTAAFALSLTTSIISAWSSHLRDIHDRQAQLASTIQTMADFSIKQVEVIEKFKNTPYESFLNNLYTSHINTLWQTAENLALSLGTYATTAELIMIAQTLGAASYGGDSQNALVIGKLALAAAKNANDESVALRTIGMIEMANATTSEMRMIAEQRFQNALTLEQKYTELARNPYAIHFIKAAAEFAWADATASYDCPHAQEHFASGTQYLLGTAMTPEMDQMRRNELTRYTTGIGGTKSCLPGQSLRPQLSSSGLEPAPPGSTLPSPGSQLPSLGSQLKK
jgi:hypothetical protein